MPSRWLLAFLGAALSACNAPDPPESTGGTDIPAGPCGRGMVVVGTDDQSTNISLLGLDGTVLSSSFVSSATKVSGLSTQLGNDVVPPTMPTLGESIVLLDRYPASVLTWVDVKSAKVVRQLSVRTGFEANPHDYLELSPNKAYITRYDRNPLPGSEDFDLGDDILVIDPSAPTMVGSIGLDSARPADPKFQATPDQVVRVGDDVIAVLLAETSSHLDSAPSRLVRIDPAKDVIEEVLELDGFHECLALAVAPDGHRLALGCAGRWSGGYDTEPDESGVVVVETQGKLEELGRFPASELGASPGYGLAWVSNDALAVATLGSEVSGKEDRLLELDLSTGTVSKVWASDPFKLPDVRCAPDCGACFATDEARGAVVRLEIQGGHLVSPSEIEVDSAIGLPPRWLGQF